MITVVNYDSVLTKNNEVIRLDDYGCLLELKSS